MEKFYKITKGSEFYKEYFDYLENTVIVNEAVKEFMTSNSLETSEYYPSNKVLYIVPTSKDLENYGAVVSKDIGNGLRPFKKTSKINKSWVDLLVAKKLKVLDKPRVCFIFDVIGKFSTRLFHVKDDLYCSMKAEHNFCTPKADGFLEIKASEFYKIIEEEREESEKVS